MSFFDLSQEWKLSAPDRERMRQEKMRYLHRIHDERELRVHSIGHDNSSELISNVIQQIEQSTVRLKNEVMRQQALTIEDIRKLQDLLGVVKADHQVLLNNAYVLSNGQRVFRTIDGEKVYTEDGVELDKDIIDPDLIGDDKTFHETHQKSLKKIERIEKKLLSKHRKLKALDLDAEALNSDDLTVEKLDGIQGRLELSKLDTTLKEELDLNPELLSPNPTAQFKMAVATMPPPSKFDLDKLIVNSPNLNG